jgi:hypothetical protein
MLSRKGRLLRTALIDEQPVIVTWVQRHHPQALRSAWQACPRPARWRRRGWAVSAQLMTTAVPTVPFLGCGKSCSAWSVRRLAAASWRQQEMPSPRPLVTAFPGTDPSPLSRAQRTRPKCYVGCLWIGGILAPCPSSFLTSHRVDAAAGAALLLRLTRGAICEPTAFLAPHPDVGLRRAANPAIAEKALAAEIVRRVAQVAEVEAILLRPSVQTPAEVGSHAEAVPSSQHAQQVAANARGRGIS